MCLCGSSIACSSDQQVLITHSLGVVCLFFLVTQSILVLHSQISGHSNTSLTLGDEERFEQKEHNPSFAGIPSTLTENRSRQHLALI